MRRRISARRRLSSILLSLFLLVAIGPVAIGAAQGADELPTPYTADQIRDAWVEGFWIETRTTQGETETFSRTRVTAWAEAGASMTDQEIDAEGNPIGPLAEFDVTWEELRDHARFPAGAAQRERAQRVTPLGVFEGWHYTLVAGDSRSEFFFADELPGAPIVYSQSKGGELAMLAEQVARFGFEPDEE